MVNQIKLVRNKREGKEIEFDGLLIQPLDLNYMNPFLKAHQLWDLLCKTNAYFEYIRKESKRDIDHDELILDEDGIIVGNKNQSEYLQMMKPLTDCNDFIKKHPFDIWDLIHLMTISNEAKESEKARLRVYLKLANDPKQLALRDIEKEFTSSTYPFEKRGYRAKFCKEMAAKYPIIESIKTIENLFDRLRKSENTPPAS